LGAATARPLPGAESLGLRAAFHVASGRPKEAAALASRALAADPTCAAAHEALALAAWRDARTADAIAALEKAVAAPGASDFAHFLHGQLVWSDSKDERAPLDRVVASLRLAVEKNPGYAEAHEALALALDATGAPLRETLPLAVKASRLEPSEMRYRITALRLSAHGGGAEDARKAARQMLASAQGEDRRQLEQLIAEISDPKRLPPEAACADGHLPSCQELGKRFAQGAGVAKDEARAAFLFQKTCNGGVAEGCESLGYALEKGAGVPADMAAARPYYRKACDAGQLWSCTRLGIALAQAEGGPADPAAAREALEKPCAAGEPDACAPLGSLLRRGEGGPKDLARAESLLRAACDKGSGWGCGELGSLVAGRGTPSALKEAALLYEKACDAGTRGACAFLAQLLELGRGVPRDLERARALYRSACDGGYATACGKAGAQAAGSK
jgi:TPR repeat protein